MLRVRVLWVQRQLATVTFVMTGHVTPGAPASTRIADLDSAEIFGELCGPHGSVIAC